MDKKQSTTAQTAEPASTTSAQKPTKKCCHLPIIIILSVLAVVGIGFGVFELVQNINQSDKIAQLNTTIDDKNQTASKSSANGTGDNTSDNAVVSDSNASSDKYLYFPSEGVKIEVPENISSLSYEVNGYRHYICITATTTDLIQQYGLQYTPEFLNPDQEANAYLGCITMNYHDDQMPLEPIWLSDDLSYVVSGPQAVYSTDSTEKDFEAASAQFVMNDLLKNNVSAL